MSKEKGRRDFRGEERLDISDRHQVEFWMKRWGITRDQLTAAHRAAGNHTKDIAVHLGKRR
jgi:hypothetical protein